MRRCQRLPDVTHPVDSTRPVEPHIKSRALGRCAKSLQNATGKPPLMSRVRDWRRPLTSTQNGFVDRCAPRAGRCSVSVKLALTALAAARRGVVVAGQDEGAVHGVDQRGRSALVAAPLGPRSDDRRVLAPAGVDGRAHRAPRGEPRAGRADGRSRSSADRPRHSRGDGFRRAWPSERSTSTVTCCRPTAAHAVCRDLRRATSPRAARSSAFSALGKALHGLPPRRDLRRHRRRRADDRPRVHRRTRRPRST